MDAEYLNQLWPGEGRASARAVDEGNGRRGWGGQECSGKGDCDDNQDEIVQLRCAEDLNDKQDEAWWGNDKPNDNGSTRMCL